MENAAWSKMQPWKPQDWKTQHQRAKCGGKRGTSVPGAAENAEMNSMKRRKCKNEHKSTVSNNHTIGLVEIRNT